MKLLIITQVVDTEHPALGFFVRWIALFAERYDAVTVLCLETGAMNALPANVSVVSLGKDRGYGRLRQLMHFYRYVIGQQKKYDQVFVHMNPLYVVLAGIWWRLCKKRIMLWYTHGTVTLSLRLATVLANVIFTASEESFRIVTTKKIIIGHGIDTEQFTPQSIPKDLDLIIVGRISPAKNLKALLPIVAEVTKTHPITLTIIGKALTETDRTHKKQLESMVGQLSLKSVVHFVGAVSHVELPTYINRAKVFVTTAKNGSLDKVMLEALACGVPVVSSAAGSQSLPLGTAQVADQPSFVAEIIKVLESNNYCRSEYVNYVRSEHGLKNLIGKMYRHAV